MKFEPGDKFEPPALAGGTLVRHCLLKQEGENVTAKLDGLALTHGGVRPPRSSRGPAAG